ncbi:MAG: FHA domain-containing protein [Myxococcota bacterium]
MSQRKTLLQRRQAPTLLGLEPTEVAPPRPLRPEELSATPAAYIVIVTDEAGVERTESYDQTELMIGRTIDNEVYLPSERVSRCHAMLTRDDDGSCLVVDMGSTNGTFVAGRAIGRDPTRLTPDDVLQIGGFALRVYGLTVDHTTPRPASAKRRVEPARTTSSPAEAPPVPASQPSPALERSAPPPPRSSAAPPRSSSAPPSSQNATRRRKTNFRTTIVDPPPEPSTEVSADLVAALVRRVARKLSPEATDEQRQACFGEELVHLTSRANLHPKGIKQLTETAHGELFGLGPLGPYLERPDVERVRVHRRGVALHDGQGWREEGATYSCREAVARSVERLHRGGAHLDDWEVSYVELPEEQGGSLIDLRRRPALHPLEAWARHGAASPSMVRMLEQAMVERLNILVVGHAPELLGSLAMLTPAPEGLWIGAPPGSDFDGTILRPRGDALASTITSSVTRAFGYVFLPDAPGALNAVLEAVVCGLQGLVTMWPAHTTEVAVHRATTHLAAMRGCEVELAWSQLASCFDLAVEVGPGRGLRPIERIARFESDGSLVDLQRHEDGRFESLHPPAVS